MRESRDPAPRGLEWLGQATFAGGLFLLVLALLRGNHAVALGSLDDAQSGLAAGVNDVFRQSGIAVGVAAYGVLVPAGAAFAHGSSASFVSGLHETLWIGAGVAAVGAVVAAKLIGTKAPAPQVVPTPAAEAIPELA